MARSVLVSGAGGFVGANLCRRLLGDGHEVHALVRPGGDLWRLAGLRGDLALAPIDLRDRDALAALLDAVQPDWVFHLAAHGGYSWQVDVEAIFATNAIASGHLLDLAAERGFEAFVQAGSSSEYGFKDHPPHEQEWIEPNSAYAVSKAAATHYGRLVARQRGVHVVTLRLYSAYGPWEEPNRLLPTLAMHGLRGGLPRLVDPSTARDFVFVDDVCQAFLASASATSLEPGAVLNVGSGTQTTLEELVAVARRELGIEEEPQWASMPARSWDTSSWVANCERIRAELGWEPRWTLVDGFRALVEWLRYDPDQRQRYAREIGLAPVTGAS
jgi:nucleoside-diphosphate-sugar epimerase